MFTQLKQTIRILTYRNSAVNGPDAVIKERPAQGTTGFGKFVAGFIEVLLVGYSVGFIAAKLGSAFHHLSPAKTVSLTTLVGALGALLFWFGHSMLGQLQALVKKRLNLADKLAPYFGHKMTETYRALRH